MVIAMNDALPASAARQFGHVTAIIGQLSHLGARLSAMS